MRGSRPPRFSVVMPTYNRAALLSRAVRSVLDQTMDDLELIVVDDGSTDETLALLAGLHDDRIRVVAQENKGASSARNAGIDVAVGELLTFLDSDDEAVPHWLEAMAKPFDDPACLLVRCGVRSVLAGEQTDRIRPPATFLAGTYAVRRSVLVATGGFLDGLAYSENTELAMRLIDHVERFGRLASVDEALVVMHRHGSGGSVARRAESILRIVDEHRARFDADPARLARWLAIAGVDLARAGDLRQARRLFRRAWRAQPLRVRHGARFAVAGAGPVARWVWGRPHRSARTSS